METKILEILKGDGVEIHLALIGVDKYSIAIMDSEVKKAYSVKIYNSESAAREHIAYLMDN